MTNENATIKVLYQGNAKKSNGLVDEREGGRIYLQNFQ